MIVSDGAPLAAWRDAGDGTFALMTMVGTPGMLGAAAGDVDGDGSVDLVAAGGTSAHVWLNDGAGHFREGSAGLDVAPTDATAVALGDLDGDGNLDLVIGQGNTAAAVARVYLNDKAGSGHFTFTPAALPPKPARASAIAARRHGQRRRSRRRDGHARRRRCASISTAATRSSTIAPSRSCPIRRAATCFNVAAADLDGDCLPDLVVPRAGAAPLLWRSAGAGKLAAATALRSIGRPQSAPASTTSTPTAISTCSFGAA